METDSDKLMADIRRISERVQQFSEKLKEVINLEVLTSLQASLLTYSQVIDLIGTAWQTQLETLGVNKLNELKFQGN